MQKNISDLRIYLPTDAIYTTRAVGTEDPAYPMAWLINNLTRLEPNMSNAYLAALIGVGTEDERESFSYFGADAGVVDLNAQPGIQYNIYPGENPGGDPLRRVKTLGTNQEVTMTVNIFIDHDIERLHNNSIYRPSLNEGVLKGCLELANNY